MIMSRLILPSYNSAFIITRRRINFLIKFTKQDCDTVEDEAFFMKESIFLYFVIIEFFIWFTAFKPLAAANTISLKNWQDALQS